MLMSKSGDALSRPRRVWRQMAPTQQHQPLQQQQRQYHQRRPQRGHAADLGMTPRTMEAHGLFDGTLGQMTTW